MHDLHNYFLCRIIQVVWSNIGFYRIILLLLHCMLNEQYNLITTTSSNGFGYIICISNFINCVNHMYTHYR